MTLRRQPRTPKLPLREESKIGSRFVGFLFLDTFFSTFHLLYRITFVILATSVTPHRFIHSLSEGTLVPKSKGE